MAQQHVHQKNPPRRTGIDPRRPDLGVQSRCCTYSSGYEVRKEYRKMNEMGIKKEEVESNREE